jgi:hypothetical protein
MSVTHNMCYMMNIVKCDAQHMLHDGHYECHAQHMLHDGHYECHAQHMLYDGHYEV